MVVQAQSVVSIWVYHSNCIIKQPHRMSRLDKNVCLNTKMIAVNAGRLYNEAIKDRSLPVLILPCFQSMG